MTTIKKINSAILASDQRLLDDELNSVLSSNIPDKEKAETIGQAMTFACNNKSTASIIDIFKFTQLHAVSFSMKELFYDFNLNRDVGMAVNPALFTFLENISTPYSSQQFSTLKIDNNENFLDPITQNIINFPVKLHGKTFDFDTLESLNITSDATRLDPFNRKAFLIADIHPDIEMYNKIQNKINVELTKRKEIVKKTCIAASKDNIDTLKSIIASNPQTDINEPFKDGYSALHYSCDQGMIENAKWLLENGADLSLKAGKKNVTPFSILHTKHPKMAKELKDYWLNMLQEKIKSNDANSHLQYARLFLNGVAVEKNIEQAIFHLEQAGKNGNINGYIEAGDVYASGFHGVEKNNKLAKDLYQNAFEMYSDDNALLKLSIIKTAMNDFEFKTFEINKITTLAQDYNPTAQYVYAFLLIKGVENIVSINTHNAILYLRRASDHGLALAQHLYADCLFHGLLVTKNVVEAVKYFKLAADQGLAEAQFMYAERCCSSDDVHISKVDITKYFKLAADQGSAIAQLRYAMQCMNGVGTSVNYVESAKYLKLAADQGLKEAQYSYAMQCEYGDVITENKDDAVKYFKLAADQGLADAQLEYANCVMDGEGIHVNRADAAKYYKLAADQGLEEAQCKYAFQCTAGNGIPVNKVDAATYFKLAADQGSQEAQYVYGDCAMHGDGIPVNRSDAAKYYKLAADQGFKQAQYSYAIQCMTGNGIQLNHAEAVKYFKLAANQGSKEAQFALSSQYINGGGVSKNKM